MVVSEKKVWQALKEVIDPELGINIVDLGLVYELKVEDGRVYLKHSLTTPACPLAPIFNQLVAGALKKIGVKDYDIELTFDPAWKPEKMSDEAKAELGWEA